MPLPGARVAIALVALTATGAVRQGADPPRAFLLDAGARSLSAVDMATGSVLARVTLDGAPQWVFRTPDGSRLVVADPGPGKMTHHFGYRPTGRAWATIVDGVSLRVVSRVELGWNLADVIASRDARSVTLVCPGYRSKKPEEALPGELVTVDLATGAVRGRVALGRPIAALATASDGTTGVAFAAADGLKGAAPRPAEALIVDVDVPALVDRVSLEGEPERPVLGPRRRHLAFFSRRRGSGDGPPAPPLLQILDLSARRVTPTLTLEGDPVELAFSPDEELLYLLEAGRPSSRAEKSISGRIQVISVSEGRHEVNLEAGLEPRGLTPDDEGRQTLVLSDGPRSKETGRAEGELRVVRGAEIAATLKVVASPLFLTFAPHHDWLYVMGRRGLSRIDPLAMRAMGEIPLEPAGANVSAADRPQDRLQIVPGGMWLASSPHLMSELALSGDARRGFVLYEGSNRLSVLDLEGGKVIGSVTTGRGSRKLLKNLGAVALSVGVDYALYGPSSDSYWHDVWYLSPAPPKTSVAIRPDGRFAYVLNTLTNDVTIVDADTAAVVDKVPATGHTLTLLTGGTALAVIDEHELTVVDTVTNRRGEALRFEDSRAVSLVLSPDGNHALAAGGGSVYCLDGKSGKLRGRVAGFKAVTQVLVEDAVVPDEATPSVAPSGSPTTTPTPP